MQDSDMVKVWNSTDEENVDSSTKPYSNQRAVEEY
jgi:hypothetical protein